jgi:CheY-like chemotaxis protein
MITGPIVLIDDEKEDILFFKEALNDLGVENEIISFSRSTEALHYLETTSEIPFIVFCDINMPRINGIELRKKLGNTSRRASIFPFLFLSTSSGPLYINDAFEVDIQGYFVKPTNIKELEEMFKSIINYWRTSKHP